MIGNKIHNLAKKLWPINRSITGQGNRETLKVLKEVCPHIDENNYFRISRIPAWGN